MLEKKVWDDELSSWVDMVNVDVDEVVLFNISVFYNGSFNASNVMVVDQLPDNMSFLGNATVNGIDNIPVVDSMNHTLTWNFSSLEHDTNLQILYNCSVNAVSNFSNTATVSLTEENQTVLSSEKSAYVRVYGNITVGKKVWDDELSSWVDMVNVDVDEVVLFNISVFYNGSFNASNVMVVDQLPDNMSFLGNATVNGIDNIPVVDSLNHTLTWNIGSMESSMIFIEFNASIEANTSFTNFVEVTANESIGGFLSSSDSASVIVSGSQGLICNKKVRQLNQSWKDEINGYVGDNVSFNISLSNVGNSTLYNLNILDKMPESLTYINGTGLIVYKNYTFNAEPEKNEENNHLLWANINGIIHDYVSPNQTVSIIFNATISDEGRLVNIVNVTSTVCDECDPVSATDYAVVNATVEIPDLSVSANGPYYDYINQLNLYTAIASGGVPPYSFSWDIDDDGEFDDGDTSSISKIWDETGNYTIHVKVKDNENETAFDTTFVNVSIPQLMVDAGGPYETFAGELVSFEGMATGGVGNYTWQWDFGDGNTSSEQNPIHTYMAAGNYLAKLTVSDEDNNSQNDTAQVLIRERDTVPPIISLDKPINAVYVNDRPIFPFFRPLVFGDVNISVSAYDEQSSVDYIELYVNDFLVGTYYDNVGNYSWDERLFGRQIITVKAFDVAGNYNVVDEVVWKFF